MARDEVPGLPTGGAWPSANECPSCRGARSAECAAKIDLRVGVWFPLDDKPADPVRRGEVPGANAELPDTLKISSADDFFFSSPFSFFLFFLSFFLSFLPLE